MSRFRPTIKSTRAKPAQQRVQARLHPLRVIRQPTAPTIRQLELAKDRAVAADAAAAAEGADAVAPLAPANLQPPRWSSPTGLIPHRPKRR